MAALCVVVSITAVRSAASAQSFRLDRFHAVERHDDAFATRRLNEFERGDGSLQLTLDYAHRPLVLEDSRNTDLHVVEHALTGDLVGGFALARRAFVFVGIDAPLQMSGDAIPGADQAAIAKADGPGLGEARAGARGLFVGGDGDVFKFGGDVIVTLPVGEFADSSQTYRANQSVGLEPELIAELEFGRFTLAANAGLRVRKRATWNQREIGSEAKYALAASLAVTSFLTLHLEGYGALGLSDVGQKESLPLELLFGLKGHVKGFRFGLAGGAGIISGIGTPDARVIGQLGWAPEKPKPEPVVAPPPPPPPPRPSDRDHDGILDPSDMCPDAAEDTDGFQDLDGCPDPDNDGDGVLDVDDRCPEQAEDKDGYQDDDGCPDPDNDGDGLADADDQCPDQKGPADNHGCPLAVVKAGKVEIKQEIQFDTGKDSLLPESTPILSAVEGVLDDTPQIRKLRVEGHTDNQGKRARNLSLSRKRALAVKKWLTMHGVDGTRLEAWGCGDTVPAVPNDSAEHRAQNRRVAFILVEVQSDAAAVGAAPVKTCVKAEK